MGLQHKKSVLLFSFLIMNSLQLQMLIPWNIPTLWSSFKFQQNIYYFLNCYNICLLFSFEIFLKNRIFVNMWWYIVILNLTFVCTARIMNSFWKHLINFVDLNFRSSLSLKCFRLKDKTIFIKIDASGESLYFVNL